MDFNLLAANGEYISTNLFEYISQFPKTLLYFYPKDNTPGCTKEAQDFTKLQAEFSRLGIHIIGVSKDDFESHEKFRVSCALGIDLIAGPDGILHDKFSVVGQKNIYGRIVTGVIRSTFLLDQTGNILQEWRNVKATGHADSILKKLQ